MTLVSLFCKTDDFFLAYQAYLTSRVLENTKGIETRGRRHHLQPSAVMTLLIAFHVLFSA